MNWISLICSAMDLCLGTYFVCTSVKTKGFPCVDMVCGYNCKGIACGVCVCVCVCVFLTRLVLFPHVVLLCTRCKVCCQCTCYSCVNW